MDQLKNFLTIGRELSALRDRMGVLMDNPHWLTIGELRESVVRSVLRRYLPTTAVVGRGFVVGETFVSSQTDILIYDSASPVLFREGDLVFVTPDAVLGMIEVKSRVSRSTYRTAARKLCQDIGRVRRDSPGKKFAALFAFELGAPATPRALLDPLADIASTWNERLNFAACGDDVFVRYWDFDPADPGERYAYEKWHGYALDGAAAGYFVHNVIEAISPDTVGRNPRIWYPAQSKELRSFGAAAGRWPSNAAG